MVLCGILLFTIIAHAAAEPAGTYVPDQSYLGRQKGSHAFVNVASHNVQVGLLMFYRLKERWPTSWQEVAVSGIWQTPLLGYKNESIDPDDRRLDFWGDVQYDPSSDPPRVISLSFINGAVKNEHVVMRPIRTYRELFKKIDDSEGGNRYSALLADKQRMLQFSIIGGIRRNLSFYKDIHRDYPRTFREFLESGLGPIDTGSRNPVTGLPFGGLGKPNDILYVYKPSVSKGQLTGSVKLVHILANGSEPQFGFSY
jgi:hypothetical protein